jgi:hypothetical protein
VSVTPVSAIGEVALWASCGLGIVTAWKRTRSWAVATLAAALTASAVLFWAFATDQFRFEAVDSYSRSAAGNAVQVGGVLGRHGRVTAPVGDTRRCPRPGRHRGSRSCRTR